MLKKANKQEIEEIYQYLCEDFPEEERTFLTLEKLIEYAQKQSIEVLYFEEDGKKKGYYLAKRKKDAILIIFLAIYPSMRGNGTGTRMLQEIQGYYKSYSHLLLEVETPDTAKEPKEIEIREKRIRFYEKQNFEQVPWMKYKLFNVEYHIMLYSYHNQKMGFEEMEKLLRDFYSFLSDKKQLQIELIP